MLVKNEANQEAIPESRGLARIGILVTSDRASRGEYNDESDTAINNFLNKTAYSNCIAVMKIVSDGIDSVAKSLVPTIPYCLDLIGARPIEVNSDAYQAFCPDA